MLLLVLPSCFEFESVRLGKIVTSTVFHCFVWYVHPYHLSAALLYLVLM
ncbi:MAG: hypothetical protein ACP5C3_00620 [Methanomicrobiales archaeon]